MVSSHSSSMSRFSHSAADAPFQSQCLVSATRKKIAEAKAASPTTTPQIKGLCFFSAVIAMKMPLHLEYTKKALLVNGQALQPALDEKYKMLIRLLDGFVPTKETDIYSLNR